MSHIVATTFLHRFFSYGILQAAGPSDPNSVQILPYGTDLIATDDQGRIVAAYNPGDIAWICEFELKGSESEKEEGVSAEEMADLRCMQKPGFMVQVGVAGRSFVDPLLRKGGFWELPHRQLTRASPHNACGSTCFETPSQSTVTCTALGEYRYRPTGPVSPLAGLTHLDVSDSQLCPLFLPRTTANRTAVLIMIPGLGYLYSGLVRRKNALREFCRHALMSYNCLC